MEQYFNITGSVTELISLVDAKKQLRVDDVVTHDDDQIRMYISEAREIAEGYIGRLIGERDLEIVSSGYVTSIPSAYTPINSIAEISVKENGSSVTLDSLVHYDLRGLSKFNQQIIYKGDLPVLDTSFKTPVITNLKVGYNSNNCPKSIISAMKLIISRLYEFREDSAQQKTLASHNILRSFKAWN